MTPTPYQILKAACEEIRAEGGRAHRPGAEVVKSAEFAGLIRKRGYTKEYVIQLIEARDREVRAAALRKAADVAVYANLAEQLRDMADRIERGE